MKAKKDKFHFICQSCGFESPRWLGRCSECGEWNSMVEQKIPQRQNDRTLTPRLMSQPIPLGQIDFKVDDRIACRSVEFNRVLGGGIVPGSVVLVGGDPGIGKSTLMLQEGAKIARPDFTVLYVSGEESAAQIRMRADRLGIHSDHFLVLAETDMDVIAGHIDQVSPQLIIVDSIQTIYRAIFESAPGTISQIRECAYQFINIAKNKNIPVFLIGHVTKEGYIAGPKVLEHMVDTLLYFEGDKDHFYRILRAVKNRFGSTNEIGVFEMNDGGLSEVTNPSEMFLSQRNEDITGSTVICALEGTRPLLLEIQALVSPSNYGLPQRTATGIDSKRLAILLAVIEKRAGFRLGTQDVFINAVGGIRIDETAADLGIAISVASSVKNVIVDPYNVVIGEIGLGGEIRAVSQIDKRLGEAEKLGFRNAVIPAANKLASSRFEHLTVHRVAKLDQAIQIIFHSK